MAETDGRATGTSGRPATDWAAFGAALVAVTLWASAFVGIRAVIGDLSPGPLAFGRLFAASVALGVLVAIRRPAMPSRRALLFIVGSGLVYVVETVSLNAGERFVDAGTAAMLVNTGPILIAVLGGVVLGEGFPPRLLLGSLVAFGGATIIGLATSTDGVTQDAALGVALCLGAAVAYAVGVVLQKPAVRTTPALTVAWLACLVSTIACLPFAPDFVREAGIARPETLAWVVYLGTFPTAIAFTMWAFALRRTTAGRLGSTYYLVPAIAIVLGWLILSEVPPGPALIGGALAIGGVVIAQSRPARPRADATVAAAPR